MDDKCKVIVATVAFGMGINKSNIRNVVHYSLPKSIENYVQEIGRSGRDGEVAYCHMFYDMDDYFKLKSLVFSNSVEYFPIKKFCEKIFTSETMAGKYFGLGHEKAETEFDMKQQVMSTIFAYLELERYIRILPTMNMTLEVKFHKTEPKVLSKLNKLVGFIFDNGKIVNGGYRVPIVDAAMALNCEIEQITEELVRLQRDLSEISYEISEPGYFVKILNIPEDVASVAKGIFERLCSTEHNNLLKLNCLYACCAPFQSVEEFLGAPEDLIKAKGLAINCALIIIL